MLLHYLVECKKNVCCNTDDAQLKAILTYACFTNFSEVDLQLHFCANFVVDCIQIWVLEHKHDVINVGVSDFGRLKWRLCALIELTHCFVGISRTHNRSHT